MANIKEYDKTITVRLSSKLLQDYNELCKKKGVDRSTRLRNFMLFELKKYAENQKIEAEQKPNDGFVKPKDLNTGIVTTE